MDKKEFYDLLVKETGYQDSYEDFDSLTATPSGRKDFYDVLVEETGYQDDYDFFESIFAPDISPLEIGKASAQATGQATKEQPKVAHPVTAVQASDRGPFYTTKAFGDWLNGQPNPQMVEQTKAINQAQASGQVTETPTAPSAPKAEDITTTKVTATTAEAPKVETTANPVSALQKADGTPYSAEELQATADKQQGSAVAEQPTVQVESVEESQVGPTETDQAKLETKVTKAEGDQKAESKENAQSIEGYMSQMNALYGNKYAPQRTGDTQTMNLNMPYIEGEINIGVYRNWLDKATEKYVRNVALTNKMKELGVTSLNQAQLIEVENAIKNMSEKEIVEMLGEDGMKVLQGYVNSAKKAEERDDKNTGVIGRLFNNPTYRQYLERFVDKDIEDNEAVSILSYIMQGADIDLGTMPQEQAERYIEAKALRIDSLFDKSGIDYFINAKRDDKVANGMYQCGMIYDKLFNSNAPNEAIELAKRTIKSIEKNGQLGTEDGVTRLNDVLTRAMEFGVVIQDLTPEDEKRILNELRVYFGGRRKITTIEDVAFSDDYGWELLKNNVIELKQAKGMIQSLDDNIDKLNRLERYHREYISQNKSRVERDPYTQMFLQTSGADDVQMQMINVAREYYTDAEKLLNDSGKTGIKGFVAGFSNAIFDEDSWSFGFTDLKKNLIIRNALEKYHRIDSGQSKEQMSDYELALLDAFTTYVAAESLSDPSIAYNVGSGTAISIPYVLQIALTPTGGGRIVAKTLLKYAQKRVKSGLLKGIVKNGAKGVGILTNSATNVLTTGLGNVASKATEVSPKVVNVGKNEDGNLAFGGVNEEELSRNKVDAKKVAESIYSQFKTYLIETTGGVLLDKVFVMPKWAKNFFDEKGIEIPKNETWEGALNRMGYNKVLSEFGEEIMDQMAEVPVSELTLDTNEETGVFSGENIATTALTTMVLSTLLNVPNAMAYKSKSARMKADVENLANSGQKAFGKQWDGLQAKIDGATFGEMSQVMSDISNDKNMSSSQKKHALKYAVAKAVEKEFVTRYEGEQMARENSAPIKAQAEIEDATIKGLNVKSASESRELQVQEKVAGNSMAETLGVNGITEAEQTLSQRYGTTDASELAISVAQDADLSEGQKRVIQDYLNVKATNLAKQNKVEKDNRKAMAEARQGIADKTHGDGSIYQAELKNGETTYIKVGDVSTDKDGKLTTNKDGDNIIVVDENGNKDMISPKEVVSITPIDVDSEIDMAMRTINAEYAKNLAIANGEYAEGDVVTLRTYNGEEQGYSNTNVTIVRESQGADGTIMIECITEDGSTLILSKDDFYKMADGAIEERVAPTVQKTEVVKPKEQATQSETTQEQSTFKGITPTETEQVVESAAPQQEYYPGKAIVYKDADDVYRMGEVVSETDADGNVIIADGITGITQQLPTTQLDQWQQEANAPQMVKTEETEIETPTQEQPVAENTPIAVDVTEEVETETPTATTETEEAKVDETPTAAQAEVAPQVVEQPQATTAQVEIPTDKKGKKVYEQAPIEATINDIYNDPDLDEEEVDAYVQAKIDGATKRIKAIDKKKPKMGEDRDAYVAQRDAWRAKRGAEQASLDYWQGVQAQRAKEKSYETDGVIDESNEPIMSAEESVDGEGGSNVLQGEQLDNNRGNERIARESQGSNVSGIDSNATSQEEIAEAKEAEQYYVDNDNTPGVVGSSYARAVLPSNVAVKLGKMAKALGVSIRIVPTMTDANAKIQGKKVVVAWNAEQIKMFGEDGLWMVVGHELTHRIKALSKEAYEDFASVIESIFPKQFKQRMINTRLAYSRKGMKISDAGLREEVVSDLAGILMTDDKMMAKFLDGLQPKSTKQQILDILKDMFDTIKNIFKDKTAMNIAKAERVLLNAMKKANKVVAQDETTEADSASEKLSIIGESGASALDRAEEATIRMDNLAKARKMERFDYPTKSIRMATGWERGADGKWRYEIDDVKLKKTTYENTETTLGELVDNAELFSAYPSLMDLKVVFTDTPNNTLGRTYSQYAEDENGQGAWIPTQISLNNLLVWDDAETESVLAHEIQHAIQSIEGFVNGGDSANKENYHRLAGEVEARNVQSRIGMTPDQRRATLLAETEDVARKDQIFLMENSGVSAMAESEMNDLIFQMKANASVEPIVEISEENWVDKIETPIGDVKMGEHQKSKLFNKGREKQYGMLLETLSNPDIILEEQSKEDPIHERDSVYLFIKTFQKEDGLKYVHFESVTVRQDGLEVSISSHIIRENQLRNKMKSDRLLYKATALDQSTNLSAEQSIKGGSLSSTDKGSDNIGDVQGLEGYSAEEIKEIAREYIEDVIAESGFDAEVVDLAIYGSRRRGDARDDSDLDIVVEYSGNVSEDGLFNALNDAETQLEINGVKVDINPITKGKSGSLNEFMKRAEEYDNDTKYSLRSNSQEVADIVAKAKADGTYMKAPNGEPTNLTEEQWANVRTKAFKNWFGDWENDPENASKVVDENGEPMVVYHGTESDFNVFDRTKGRASMDIQGMFFSPWELDAQGYGRNVRAFYLNIRKPSSGGQSYKALNRYQGQMYAGVKARDYLIGLGYDGVDNYGEEFIAFEPNQIKSATDNVEFGEGDDIRYSLRSDVGSTESALDAMKDDNSKGWESIKDKLRGTPIWNEVAKDANYTDDDAIAKESLSRLKVGIDDLTQEMTDNAKGVFEKAEAVAMADRMRRALNEFDAWVEQQVAEPTEGEEGAKYSLRTKPAPKKNRSNANRQDLTTSSSTQMNDRTKVEINPESAKKQLKDLAEKYRGINNPRGFLTDLNIALGKALDESSNYYSLELPNKGEVTIRISNHNVDAENAEDGEKERSIVIKSRRSPNTFNAKNGVDMIEYVYFKEDIKGLNDNILSQIAESLHEMMETGEYNDKSGIAKVNPTPKYSLRVGGVLHPDSDGTREEYDKRVKTTSKKFEKSAMTFYNFMEAFVDEMRSLDILQRIVEKKYGIKLPSFENALDAENRSSSMALKEFEAFMDGEYDAMMQFVDRWIKRGETTQSINYYMIAKSGLERNREFTVRDAINELLNHEDESKRITKAQAEQMRKNYADERNALLAELKSGNIDYVTFNKLADKLARKYAFGHKIEDYSGLTGITGDENNFRQIAEDMVMEFETKHEDAVVDFWSAVKDVTKAPVRKSYGSGLLSKSMYDKLTTMLEWYIPMRGFEEQTAEDVYSYIGADTGVFNPTVALAKGHTEVSDDPLAIMGNMMQSAILQGNRNVVKQRLLFMARNHPVDVLTESRVWLVLHPDGTWVSSYPELSNDMSADQVAQAIAEHEAKMEKLAKDKKAKISNVNLDIDFKIEKASNISAHAIDVMLNGNHYVIYVNGNPRVAQAVNGQLKDKGTNWLYEVWQSYARWYTASKTSLDVNFMFPNVVRDIQHSTLMTIMDKGFIQGVKFFFNGFATIIPVIKGASGVQIKDPKMRKYWDEFVKYGGETGYAHLESVDDFKRKNEKRLKRMKGAKKATTIAKGTFKYIGSAFDYANRIAESSTRFNAYVSSRKSGADIYDAIRYAKDITVNFNRKGSSMTPGIFGAVANAYRIWMPFANPIIQGIYQFLKVGRRNKGRFFTICGVQMALGFVIPMVNEILFEAIGGDDEDKYINQPDYARRTNMMFYIGGKYIKIPLPPMFRELYGLGDIAYSTMKGLYNPKEATMETVNQIRSMFSLQGQSSMKGKEYSSMRFILPGHLAWVADIAENTTFTGQPLYKEGDFIDEQTPEYQKVYNGTWRYLVEWSRELNHFLGGTDDKAAEMPLDMPSRWMNPAVWQHVISEFGGGPYKFVMDMADLVSPESNDEGEPAEFTWSKVPVAKRFVAEVGDRAETRLLNKQYYDYIDSFDDIEYEEKVYTKKAKMGSMEYAEKLNELILSPEYREYKVKNGYEKAVKDLNKYLNDPGLDKSDRKQVEDAIERFKREVLTEAPKAKNFPTDGASKKVKEKLDSIKDVVEDVIGDGNEQTKERNRVIRDAKSNLEPLDMEVWEEEQKDKVK